jgi:outer membrane protein OmpA-like peptidoglycan-associated protein
LSNLKTKPAARVFLNALLLSCAMLGAAQAADVKGGKDHPLISRFAGAELKVYDQKDFDEAIVVIKPLRTYGKVEPDAMLKLEGKVTRNGYAIKGGKTALEVMRNYEQALAQAGFQTIFQCSDLENCGVYLGSNGVNGSMMTSSLNFPYQNNDNNRYILVKRDTPEGLVHVVVYVMPSFDEVYVFQQVVESKPMATNQVQVLNAAQMAQGLKSEGKIAIYGVLFDTAKADIKPESKLALDEMVKLLAADKTLKVYVVGHTDNVGGLAANLDLSHRRADAVVKALTAQKIDAARLMPKGVASLAPVTSNANEAGRAKNRRVELVVQ